MPGSGSGSLIITFKRAPPREVLITLLASLHFMPDQFSLGCCVRQRGVGRGRGKPAGGSGYSDSNGKTWPRGRLTSLAPSQPPCTYPITREQKCRLQPLCPQCPRSPCSALFGDPFLPGRKQLCYSLAPGSFRGKGVRSPGHPKQECRSEAKATQNRSVGWNLLITETYSRSSLSQLSSNVLFLRTSQNSS